MKPLTITDPATVRGVLDGSVTEWWEPMKIQPGGYRDKRKNDQVVWTGNNWIIGRSIHAPYAVGDRLFLREAWFPVSKNYGYKKGDQPGRMYELNGNVIQWPQVRVRWPGIWVLEDAGEYWRREWYLKEYHGKPFRWRPAHTMPEWASRCVVEVESVRVEPPAPKERVCPKPEFYEKWFWVTTFRRVS